MITDEPVTAMRLERSKVNVSSYLEKTHLLGSTVEVSSSFNESLKALVLRLDAILYGREVANDTTESNEITLDVFDPDNVRDIPATWWDHLKLDLSEWIYRHFGSCRLRHWLYSRVNTIPAPQSHGPKIIAQTIHHRKVTAVCPHIGAQVKIDRHLRFVEFNLIEPCGASPIPLETAQEWREHHFRHQLLAICEEMTKAFGLNRPSCFDPSFDYAKFHMHLMEIRDLFDHYGVGA